jgi:hypothetical protein
MNLKKSHLERDNGTKVPRTQVSLAALSSATQLAPPWYRGRRALAAAY